MNRSTRSSYAQICKFGANSYSPSTNPISYSIGANMDQNFLHGSSSYIFTRQDSRNSQLFLSEYCANGWDGFCEVASKNTTKDFPNQAGISNGYDGYGCITQSHDLNSGEILIRNTAERKYLRNMGGCVRKTEPFDPTVAASPLISTWKPTADNVSMVCIPVYAVDPKEIDKDVVMDKLLQKPYIGMDILLNIYNNAKRNGTLEQLKGTKLGTFYQTNAIFKAMGGLDRLLLAPKQ